MQAESPQITYKYHSVRSADPYVYGNLAEVDTWINYNKICPVSISTVLCHSNGDLLTTIYYRQNQIPPTRVSFLHFIQKDVNWRSMRKGVLSNIDQMNIISINNLEINRDHEQKLTVVWYFDRL